MEYDTQTTLKKRYGYDLSYTTTADDSCLFPSSDEKMFFTNGSENVFVVGNGYTKTLNLPKKNESDYFQFAQNTSISSAENMLSLYFTSTDYSIPVMKYDGSHIYRAGLPTPRKSSDQIPTCTAYVTNYTSRIFYSYKDINGLTVFSPYYESQLDLGTGSLTINSLAPDSTCTENGFFDKYCWVAPSFSFIIDISDASTAYPQISSDVSRKMIIKRHNYKAGEKFLFDSENPMLYLYNKNIYTQAKSFISAEIEAVENDVTKATFTGSISGTTLTVTAVSSGTILLDGIISGGTISAETYIKAQLTGTTGGTGTYTVSNSQTVSSTTITEKISSITFKRVTSSVDVVEVGPVSQLGVFWSINSGKTEYPLDIRTKIHIYANDITTNTYTKFGEYIVDNSTKTMTLVLSGASRSFSTFARVYYSSQLNYPQYLEDVYNTSSSKIMPPYCKYITSFGDQLIFASVQSYIGFDNKKIAYNNNDLFIYSDILTGDCCENTSEFNRQKVGETYDGDISGVVRCNDSVIIFKDNSTHTVDGILSPGQYSIRKINTNGVGCKSHKSIVAVDEGVLFQAHNGIYYTNGINVTRVTQELDYLFETGDFSLTKGSRYKKRQKVVFYVPEKSKVVVFDYYYKQVYLWDGIVASNGLFEDNSGDLFFYNGTNLFKFNTSYSDNGDPINAYYATNWHHMGQPSLLKKYVQNRVFALTSDVFDLTIKFQKDWNDVDLFSVTESITTTKQSENIVHNMINGYSVRYIFSNNILDQNLSITGYEVTYEPYNVRDKN